MGRSRKILLGAAGLLALAGCGGLGSTTTTPTSTALSVAGTVSGSGSLMTLNGQPVDLSGASITVDDEPGSAADVKPGVEISGDGSDDGSGKMRMRRVDVRWRARGSVDAVDTGKNTVDVAGLRASIGASTLLFRENSDGSQTAIALADLKAGDYVRVAGLPQSDDSVVATRLEAITASDPALTALGVTARTLNSTAKTFTYGLKTYGVAYGKAEVKGTPASGAFVRVKGTRSGSTIQAAKVGFPGAQSNPPSTGRTELEGTVSGLDTPAQTFSVQGYTVSYAKATVEGTLANDARVEVHGTLTGDKAVEALKVEVETGDSAGGGDNGGGHGSGVGRLEGKIAGFGATAKTLSINGITVSVTAATKYEQGKAEISADTFWGTGRDGAYAEAKGRVSGGSLVADTIELK